MLYVYPKSRKTGSRVAFKTVAGQVYCDDGVPVQDKIDTLQNGLLTKLSCVNAVENGIDNSGSKDVTTELQQLLNENNNVFLPAGSYKLKGLKLNSNNHLIGDGIGITKIVATSFASNETVIPVIGVNSGIITNITVSDLTIDGDLANTTQSGIGIISSSSSSTITGVYLNNVKVQNVKGYEFNFDGTNAKISHVICNNIEGVKTLSSFTSSSEHSVLFIHGSVSDFEFNNSSFRSSSSDSESVLTGYPKIRCVDICYAKTGSFATTWLTKLSNISFNNCLFRNLAEGVHVDCVNNLMLRNPRFTSMKRAVTYTSSRVHIDNPFIDSMYSDGTNTGSDYTFYEDDSVETNRVDTFSPSLTSSPKSSKWIDLFTNSMVVSVLNLTSCDRNHLYNNGITIYGIRVYSDRTDIHNSITGANYIGDESHLSTSRLLTAGGDYGTTLLVPSTVTELAINASISSDIDILMLVDTAFIQIYNTSTTTDITIKNFMNGNNGRVTYFINKDGSRSDITIEKNDNVELIMQKIGTNIICRQIY